MGSPAYHERRGKQTDGKLNSGLLTRDLLRQGARLTQEKFLHA